MTDDGWYHELRARYKMAMSIKAKKERDDYARKQFANPESKFYNPDAWSRLIGKSNLVITHIDGKEVKTLLDTGAQISFMSEKYAKKRGFKIHPLEKLVNFTGANGLAIEYSGYIVEVNLQLPNKGFNKDILILVVPHIEYHIFVPITLGTHTIDEHLVTNNLVQNLETEWRLVHQAILYMQSLTKDHILGLVRATKNIIIQPFSCVNISGLVKAQKGGFSLHVVAEPSTQAKLSEGITLAGEQYLNIAQGSSRVGLLFENQTEKPITIKERTILCQLVIGNLVPKLVAPKYDISELDRHFLEEKILTELDKEEEGYSPDEPMDYQKFKKTAENISSNSSDSGLKSANMPTMPCTATEREETSSETNFKEDGSWLFDQIDISGAKEIGEDYYQRAKALFIKYQNTFSKTDMDLGRAVNVQHRIILTDPIPFKERYRRIPPQLYDEVRNHLQEMLRLGAIRRSV